MSIFRNLFGPSAAEKQQLVNQINNLNKFVSEHQVDVFQNDDINNPFVKCKYSKEKLNDDMDYFLNLTEPDSKATTGFVPLSRYNNLSRISRATANIVGIPSTDIEFRKKVEQIFDNYLFKKRITQQSESKNTLFGAISNIDAQLKQQAALKEEEVRKQQELQRKEFEKRQDSYESDRDYALRMVKNEEYCHDFFYKNYLRSSASNDFRVGLSIWGALLQSLGSTDKDYFVKYREKTPSEEEKQKMKSIPEKQLNKYLPEFIGTLCSSGKAYEIINLATDDSDVGYTDQAGNTYRGAPVHDSNRWKAFIMCLESLEAFLLEKIKEQEQENLTVDKACKICDEARRQVQAGVQAEGQSGVQAEGQSGVQAEGQSGVQAEGQAGVQAEGQSGVQAEGQSGVQAEGQSGVQAEVQASQASQASQAGVQASQGGKSKSKSKSKSNRKKRISRRQKKYHGNKRRTIKRR